MKPEIKKELMPIVCALGFLSVYATENKKELGHPVWILIKDLQRIVKLYKSQYSTILDECFRIFDKITGEKAIQIDTIAFTNAMLVFHQQMKNKKFHPSYKKVNNFWMAYKKQTHNTLDSREKQKEMNIAYGNSRLIAREFFEIIGKD